ncbi:piwi-like protein Siwi [Branchiostoma floridae x Branchiostoma japonicum]
MSQQQGRARGRARGRGRGTTNEPSPRRPGAQAPPQGPLGVQAGQPMAGQGGPPMGAQYAVGPMAAQGGARPPMAAQGGPPMGSQYAVGPPMGAQVGPPMGAQYGVGQPMAAQAPPTSELEALTLGEKPGGGGARRRRGGVVVEEPHTRPGNLLNKKGTTGNKVSMITNFFKVKPKPQWVLFQYHVDFSPEVDHRKARIAMVYGQEALLGDTKLFDGMILFLPKRLENDQTVVYTKRKTDDADIRITITLTNEVPPTSPLCLQIYNILFRKFLKNIGMQEINRNYYNPGLKVAVERHK